ncbi:MAG: DUF2203 domain-containing protein [Actinomycetota bacterium]
MTDRRFTPEEANALLPTVAPLLEQLRDAQQLMDERHAAVMDSVPGNGGGPAGVEFLDAARSAARCAAELGALGVVVRDPGSGLVDFPAERDGIEVYLCWRLGEDAIAWWHPADSGFSGRQPL